MLMRRRQTIKLIHPAGCRVDIRLPADMEIAGDAITALGRIGFEIPDAKGEDDNDPTWRLRVYRYANPTPE